MAAVTLPSVIGLKFDELARHVRRLRVYRGASRAILAGLVLAVALMAADATLSFDTTGRWLALAGWLAVMIALTWFWVLRPLRQLLTQATLAAAIETEFESLKERLFTVVDLSTSDDAHGSKPLMDVLVRDTANRTRKLKVDRAAPRAAVYRLIAAAACGMVIALGAVALSPSSAERARRFFLPWSKPKTDVPYAVKVSSGTPVVKRGDAVTLTGFLERTTPGETPLPPSATLVTRDSTGAVKKFPMIAGANAAFHVSRPNVTQSFDYSIVAGGAASDWHAVIAVDAVDIAEGTAVHLSPPAYAIPPFANTTLIGFGEFKTLSQSQVKFEMKFTRPATAAVLEWVASTPGALVERERVTLTINADRTGATGSTVLVNSGTYRLTLTGEHGIVTTVNASATAVPDAAPKFEKAAGLSAEPKSSKPDEVIRLQALASDDIAVAKLVLEYAVNGGETVTVPLPARDMGSARVEGKLLFKLAGVVKDGDAIKYRLKAEDNRDLPTAGLKPQAVYAPETGWSVLKISTAAEPLDRQEIQSARDAIASKLEDAKKAIDDAQRKSNAVRREAQDKPLTTGQHAQLEEARDAVKAAVQALEEAARDAGLTLELQPLAQGLRDAVNDAVKPAADDVEKADKNPDAKSRQTDLDRANDKLNDAAARIDQFKKLNDDLARNRLDQRRLEKLADEIEQMAEATQNAKTPMERDRLLKDLQQHRDELQNLIRGNESLRNAADANAQNDAQTLKRDAGKLADEQKSLDDAIRKAEAEARAKAQAGNAKAQEELNRDVDELRKKQKPENAPATEPFEQAAKDLKSGNAIDAMTAQEKAAKELDRTAENAKGGPEMARQAMDLAKRQRELRDETANANAKPPAPSPKAAEQEKQQDALNRKAEDLAKQMDQAANAAGRGAESGDPDKLNEAAKDTKAASDAMAKAGREQKAGRGGSAAQARADAVEKLDSAAKKAGAAMGATKPGTNPDANAQAATNAAQKAGGMLKKAGPQIGQQQAGAGQTLKNAAAKLNEAAEKLGQSGAPTPGKAAQGKPNGNDGSGVKPLTAEDLPTDLKQYAGTRWGDLPGEVKTKIVQDLKAKFGEDHARAIKYYFEQQAGKK